MGVTQERTGSPSGNAVAGRGAHLGNGAWAPAGVLLLPLAFGLEPPIAQALAPGLDGLADRVKIEGVPAELARPRHDIGRHSDEGPERGPRLDRVLPPRPRAREDARHGLDVVEEEPLRAVAQLLDPRRAADLLDGFQEVDDLLGQWRLAHAD